MILGWHDIRQRYRRSVLGPFWITFSNAITIIALGVVYSTIFKQEFSEYLPGLAVGLMIWQFIGISFTEGAASIISSGAIIKQMNIPYTIHIAKQVWRNFIVLLHGTPVILFILIIFNRTINTTLLLLIPGLILLFFISLWINIILGIICTRFRDIPPIINNFIQIVFFITPVMWSPKILGEYIWIAEWNPLFHLIEIIRQPILGSNSSARSWIIAILFCAGAFFLAQFLMKKFRNRIPYWL